MKTKQLLGKLDIDSITNTTVEDEFNKQEVEFIRSVVGNNKIKKALKDLRKKQDCIV